MTHAQPVRAIACLYLAIFTFLSCRPPAALHRITGGEKITKKGDTILLGVCSRNSLDSLPFSRWFEANYRDYTVDSVTADTLKMKLKGKKIRIFMGTWCGDSRREVPRLFKILDYCGFSPSAVELIMVGYTDTLFKQSPGHEEKGEDIFRVPDLIVLDGGRELGRIVESPVVSQEKDLLSICSGEAYTPTYKGVAFLVKTFREKKRRRILRELPELAQQIKPLLSSPTELVVYARIMRQDGELEKAEIAFRLNALIFPDKPQ